MVTRWGMSVRLGPIALAAGEGGYLGETDGPRSYSESTARRIDGEIKRIVDEQYARVRELLDARRDELDRVVEVLLKRETLHHDEFAALMRGESLAEPPPVADPPAPPPRRAQGAGDEPSGSGDGQRPPGMVPEPG